MKPTINYLNQALAFQLEGMYCLTKQLQEETAAISRAVSDPELAEIVESYRQNLADQRLRLKRIFGYLLSGPYHRKSEAFSTCSRFSDVNGKNILPHLRDVLVSDELRSTIQYMIASYNSARYIAMRSELDTVARLLDEIVLSEEEFSQKVKRLFATCVNNACLFSPVESN